jgi:hypothetical protein
VDGMDEDIEFDESFQLLPGVDLALWLTIAFGAIACVILATLVMWVV